MIFQSVISISQIGSCTEFGQNKLQLVQRANIEKTPKNPGEPKQDYTNIIIGDVKQLKANYIFGLF